MKPLGANLTILGKKKPLFPQLGQLALLESCAVVTGGVMSILAIASNCGISESDCLEFEGTHKKHRVQLPAPCRTT